jgi:anti-sigma regulatory factor (Ser/Thr protein kinase)
MPENVKKGKVFVWEGETRKGFLTELSNFVEEVGKALKVKEEELCDMQVAIGEAAANSQEHSYEGQRGKLRLEILKDKGKIEICVTDWGKSSPDVEKVPEPKIVPDLAEVDLEGLGMMMIRRAMDEVEFSITSKGGHAVRMCKRIR